MVGKYDKKLFDNQTPALTKFTIQLYILVWESYINCNILIMLFLSFLQSV